MKDITWPTINAGLNLLAFSSLVAGRYQILHGRRDRHRVLMLMAFSASAIFLASYLAYHFTGTLVTKYEGEGIIRTLYFILLISHSLLAALTAPAILYVMWAALTDRIQLHRKYASLVWYLWAYISLTGVLVYMMLYHWQ